MGECGGDVLAGEVNSRDVSEARVGVIAACDAIPSAGGNRRNPVGEKA